MSDTYTCATEGCGAEIQWFKTFWVHDSKLVGE